MDTASGTRLDIDVVVAGAIVGNVFDARREQINQLFVKRSCYPGRFVAAVNDKGIVKVA